MVPKLALGLSPVRVLVLVSAIMALSLGAAQAVAFPVDQERVLAALDESPGPWADDAIEVVVSRGLYIGYPDGTFGWQNDITRAEMAVVIARLLRVFGLDAFDPYEQQVLREAIVRLDGELAGVLEELAALRRAVQEHDGRLGDLAAEDTAQWEAIEALRLPDQEHEERLRVLEEALATLRGAASQAELDALEHELGQLGDVVASLNLKVEALEDLIAGSQAEVTQADIDALAEEIALLRGAIDALRKDDNALELRVADLESALTGLPTVDDDDGAALAALRLELNGARSDLTDATAKVDDLTERLELLEESHAELVGRVERLEAELLPDRAGFYVSVAAMGSDPVHGVLGKVSVGHDSMLGNIGFRVSYEHAFGTFASNASALATYTTSFGASDAYVGLGGGVSFETTPVFFGEMTVGIGYRIGRHLGVFVEGRYRPYFDGTNQQLGGVGGGVQLRF